VTEETLFAAALEQADPAAYLAAHCPDPDARRRVEELLAAHDAAGSFLSHPAAGDVTTALPSADPDATADPRTGPAEPDEALAFLKPPTRPGSLGRLAHYEVIEVLGSGGFGTVLKAFDDRLHRAVAVKVLAPQLAASGAARTRFEREARSAAAVRDDHVVNVYAVSEPGDPLPYLVMELVAGQTLQAKLDKAGPLPPKEVLRIGSQIARGLAAAHKQGLIHRDIKPANILLENGVERVKVTDFGLARAADDASISQSGVVAGTPMYMSPEQARGDTLDTRSDLFSLGSVLYALCTGRPPFRADTTLGVLKRVVEDEPRPVRDVNPEVPRWLADVVAKLHAKAPADRFQTAGEVAELLSGYLAELQQQGTVVSRVAAPRRKRVMAGTGWGWWFAAALTVAALLSAGGVLGESDPPVPRREVHYDLAIGFAVLGLAVLAPAAGLMTLSRRWGGRGLGVAAAGLLAAAANVALGLLAPAGDLGTVVVMPTPGLESILPHQDGKAVGDWIDVSNGHTLRLPPGHYTLEPRFAPGITTAGWDLTSNGGSGGASASIGMRQTTRSPEFELRPGGRVTVRAETTRVRPTVSWGEYVDPLGDCRLTEDAAGLTLTVPPGNHDLNTRAGANTNGPRVLREVVGDFEARVTVLPLPKPLAGTSARADGVSYVGAGLVVWQDDGNLFRLFRAGLATNNNGAPFAQAEWFPPNTDRGHSAAYVADAPMHLRLRRVGDKLYPAHSPDGKTWKELQAVTDLPLAAKLRVGVGAVSTYHKEIAFRLDAPTVEAATTPDGFTPLFNGRDLTGWKTHPDQPGEWRVDAGHLVSTRAAGYLFSEKGDWQDFHLRAEVHVVQGGNSGIFFRTPFKLDRVGGPNPDQFAPAGWYEADLFWGPVARPGRIRDLGETAETLAEPNQWMTLEIIAQGNHFITKVNGKVAVDVVDPNFTFARGHFSLQAFTANTSVRFRKIEVMELPTAAPAWVSLFDGKTLAGWKVAYGRNTAWQVRDGAIVGSGKSTGLATEKETYRDFHLRAEVKVNAGGDSGLLFRGPAATDSIQAQILNGVPENGTGSLYHESAGLAESVPGPPIPPDDWFVFEVIARGDRIETRVNGKVAARVDDRTELAGPIGLECFSAKTVVQFRKVEVKELPPAGVPGASAVPRRAADILPFWVGTWRSASELVVPAPAAGKGHGGGTLVLDLVGDGKYLRGVGTEESHPFQTLLVQTYDEAKEALRGWFYMSDGKTSGPGPGQWDANARTLQWTEKLPDGLQAVNRFEFVDADTVRARLLHQNSKNEVVFDVRQTFTRQKAAAVPRDLPVADRPAELAVLDRLVGEWRNETTRKALAPAAKDRTVTTTERGRSILGGRFVEVTHGGGVSGTNDYWLTGYDPAAKLYRTWFFGADGTTAEFAGTWAAATATMRLASPDGSAAGSWVFPGADRRDGRITMKDAAGQPVVEMTSTSRRVVPGGEGLTGAGWGRFPPGEPGASAP